MKLWSHLRTYSRPITLQEDVSSLTREPLVRRQRRTLLPKMSHFPHREQTKNHPSIYSGWFFVSLLGQTPRQLRASYVSRSRTLRAFSDLERDSVAYFEFIKSDPNEILGMEEQVLHFAFASNEPESSVRQGFDCSGHDVVCGKLYRETRLCFRIYYVPSIARIPRLCNPLQPLFTYLSRWVISLMFHSCAILPVQAFRKKRR